MTTATKEATGAKATPQTATKQTASNQNGPSDSTPIPDSAERVQRAVFAGSAQAAAPGMALLRGNPFSAGLERVVASAVEMQAETARFGAQRLHRAMEARAKLLACRSAADLQQAQQDYMRDLAADYAQEWSRVWAHGMLIAMGQAAASLPEAEGEHHAIPV